MYRRLFLRSALASSLLTASAVRAAEALLPAPLLGVDGLWAEDWFRAGSGDLRRDLALAAAEGKILVLFWERAGCEYCSLLHLEALRDPALRVYPAQRFYSMRLDRFGAEPIVDFDGARRRQSDAAVQHGVLGTPTLEFRLADGREVLRLPGYAEPAILLAAFKFVERGTYLHVGFAAWLQQRGLL